MSSLPLLPLLLGVAGLVELATALVFHLRMQQLKARSVAAGKSWLRVRARILSSRVAEEWSKTVNSSTMKVYSARFRYEYSVDGKRYEGSQYTLAKEWSSSNREPHDREAAEFPEGREVDLWVNPGDPSEAVLKVDPEAFPTITLVVFFLTLFGLGLVAAALVMVFFKK